LVSNTTTTTTTTTTGRAHQIIGKTDSAFPTVLLRQHLVTRCSFTLNTHSTSSHALFIYYISIQYSESCALPMGHRRILGNTSWNFFTFKLCHTIWKFSKCKGMWQSRHEKDENVKKNDTTAHMT